MAQEWEQTDQLRKWEGMYRNLLRISEEQRQLILHDANDERLADRFSLLAGEWNHQQDQIAEMETILREVFGQERFQTHFESNIVPIIDQIKKIIHLTTTDINQHISRTGNSLRAFQDHRQLRRAYGDSDYSSHPSIYFDEKK